MTSGSLIQYLVLGGYYQFYLEILLALFAISVNYVKRRPSIVLYPLACLIGIPFYWMPPINFLGFNFSYLIVIAAVILVSMLLFNEKIFQILFTPIAAFAIQNFCWNLNFIILYPLREINHVERWAYPAIYFSLLIVVCSLVFLIFLKGKIELKKARYNLSVYITGAVIVLIAFFISQKAGNDNIYIKLYNCLAIMFAFICLYVIPYNISQIEDVRSLNQENRILEYLIRQEEKQSRVSNEIREITNIRIHDLKHQIEMMKTLEDKEMREYIETLNDNLDIYDSFAKTGNKTVDIILTEKSLLCLKKNIRLTYIIDSEPLSTLSNVDLVSLLCNVLDNAIEAADKETEDFRIIKLNIHEINSVLVIECSNYAHSLKFFNLEKIVSSKDSNSDEMHGYGLKSIEYIAKKYEGKLSVKFENSIFTVKIGIPFIRP